MGLASEQVTGPVAVFIGMPLENPPQISDVFVEPAATTPTFFGWTRNGPEPNFDYAYSQLMADPGGDKKPHDYLYEGQDANLPPTDFSIWDEQVLDFMMNSLFQFPLGQDGPLDIGTLMVAEGCAYPLWLYYPYSVTHPFATRANMKQGYHFFAALTQHVRRPQGTKPNYLNVAWQFARVPILGDPSDRSLQYVVYNNDMSALEGVPITLNPRASGG